MPSLSKVLAAMAVTAVSADEFIVQMKPDASLDMYRQIMDTGIASDDIIAEWNFGGFVGFAFKGSNNQRLALEENENVIRVVDNGMAYADQETCNNESNNPNWGLQRVNEEDTPTYDNTFTYSDDFDGEGVVTYVLDTGIRLTHQEFGGRAEFGEDFTGDGPGDVNGHGTHVAGTIVGNTIGLARKATVVDVKVLGNSGSGSWAGIISGMEFVVEDCARRGKKVCIANMSLGGNTNTAVNAGVDAARAAGMLMVASAGNDNARDSCTKSPGGADGAFGVGSTDNRDNRSSFSNVGPCVDIWAPGSSINSAGMNADNQYRTLSGTSMSAPHAAGVAAMYLSSNQENMSIDDLEGMLKSTAQVDKISDVRNSVNLLAHIPCGRKEKQEYPAFW